MNNQYDPDPQGGDSLNESSAEHPPEKSRIDDLCQRIMDGIGVQGVAVVLTTRSVPQRVLAHCGTAGIDLPESEFTLGEGPTFDASRERFVIEAADLNGFSHTRWPAFTDEATRMGVQGIHAFPLRRGSVILGVLVLFSTRPRTFNGSQFRLALNFADEIADLLLGLPRNTYEGATWMTPEENRLRIHQATGMVAEQLNCSVEEALDRMRAFAFANQTSLVQLSEQVLQRKLLLEP